MKLAEYIAKKGWARSYVAWKLGVTETTVTRYLSGDRLPTAEVMLKIYRVTKGKVTPNDFYNLHPIKESA
jgi:DNA-binding transcriptional regulator YdaS (Cro superfamily)